MCVRLPSPSWDSLPDNRYHMGAMESIKLNCLWTSFRQFQIAIVGKFCINSITLICADVQKEKTFLTKPSLENQFSPFSSVQFEFGKVNTWFLWFDTEAALLPWLDDIFTLKFRFPMNFTGMSHNNKAQRRYRCRQLILHFTSIWSLKLQRHHRAWVVHSSEIDKWSLKGLD